MNVRPTACPPTALFKLARLLGRAADPECRREAIREGPNRRLAATCGGLRLKGNFLLHVRVAERRVPHFPTLAPLLIIIRLILLHLVLFLPFLLHALAHAPH